jgi:hypothetical protein
MLEMGLYFHRYYVEKKDIVTKMNFFLKKVGQQTTIIHIEARRSLRTTQEKTPTVRKFQGNVRFFFPGVKPKRRGQEKSETKNLNGLELL